LKKDYTYEKTCINSLIAFLFLAVNAQKFENIAKTPPMGGTAGTSTDVMSVKAS